ncbi:MAG: hypothetical protein MZV63_21575, partial [Marinilabiliales bacterium]|nr:hypothetical protein [Marinilabiliales bacterium]
MTRAAQCGPVLRRMLDTATSDPLASVIGARPDWSPPSRAALTFSPAAGCGRARHPTQSRRRRGRVAVRSGSDHAAVDGDDLSQVLSIPFVVVCLTLAIRN